MWTLTPKPGVVHKFFWTSSRRAKKLFNTGLAPVNCTNPVIKLENKLLEKTVQTKLRLHKAGCAMPAEPSAIFKTLPQVKNNRAQLFKASLAQRGC